jgi:hypothetical protein
MLKISPWKAHLGDPHPWKRVAEESVVNMYVQYYVLLRGDGRRDSSKENLILRTEVFLKKRKDYAGSACVGSGNTTLSKTRVLEVCATSVGHTCGPHLKGESYLVR